MYIYLFENITLYCTTKDQSYFAKTWGDIDEIMSKKHAEKSKKKQKKTNNMWLSENNFVQHLVFHATRNIFVTKTTKIWSETHKKTNKTHIEVLNIQKFSREVPKPPNERGIIPFSCSPPSALDGFLRRTTFQYAATALQEWIRFNQKWKH